MLKHPQGGEVMSVDRTADNQQSLDPDIGSLSLCHDTDRRGGGVCIIPARDRQTSKVLGGGESRAIWTKVCFH